MIGKIIKGRGFRGALNYLFHGNEKSRDKQSVIVAGNMAGTTPRMLATEFSALRKLRPTLGKVVCHLSLSLSPEDRQLSNAELKQVADEFMQEMGFGNAPFIAVRHHDTEHPHIHILASRITLDGGVVSDKQDFQRAEKIIRLLETKFGLRSVLPSCQTEIKTRTLKYEGDTPMQKTKRTLVVQLDQILAETTSIYDLFNACQKKGVTIVPRLKGPNVQGLIFKFQNKRVKASDLGAKYTWPGIAKHCNMHPIVTNDLLGMFRSQDNVFDNQAACPDAKPEEVREYKRLIKDVEYVDAVWMAFKDEVEEISFKDNSMFIKLLGGGSITDAGDVAYVVDVGDEAIEAELLVRLAMVKGWKTIQFTGSANFIRLAMSEALDRGLNVVPKNDQQKQILRQVLNQRSAKMVPSDTIGAEDPTSNSPLPPKVDMVNRLKGWRAVQDGEFEVPKQTPRVKAKSKLSNPFRPE